MTLHKETELRPDEGNVLRALDSRPATAFYWQLTLLSTIGGFLFGYDTSNIGSALNLVPYHLSGFAQGYLVAGASLGAAVGAIAAGPLADRFGRKSLLVLPTWQSGIGLGWVMVCFAALCVIAIGFVFRYLPETKGHSVEEIIRLFERDARQA